MCVIIASRSKKHRPTLETLRACACANPHGSGLAWIQDGRVHYIKGLRAASIADCLGALDGPVIIHFRIASVGAVRPELCHPFPVTAAPKAKCIGQSKAVLFHNGTWGGWREFLEIHDLDLPGPISDSRVAAAAAYHHGFRWLKQIPCRFAMLDVVKGITLLGDWKEQDGLWYSNDYWLPSEQRTEDITVFH